MKTTQQILQTWNEIGIETHQGQCGQCGESGLLQHQNFCVKCMTNYANVTEQSLNRLKGKCSMCGVNPQVDNGTNVCDKCLTGSFSNEPYYN